MKINRNPTAVHPPLATYSHQIELGGNQRWLVMSGQIGMEKDGTLPSDPIKQFRVALANIDRNLRAADMGISDLVKLTIYLADEMDAERRRALLGSWLAGHKPTMTLLYVASLASPDFKVEIEALACEASE